MEIIGILAIIATILLIGYIAKKLFIKDKSLCDDCEGKGYYLALRGREPCPTCKGSGKSN